MYYIEFLMNENCILNVSKSALQFVSCCITFIKHNKHKMSIVCTGMYMFKTWTNNKLVLRIDFLLAKKSAHIFAKKVNF